MQQKRDDEQRGDYRTGQTDYTQRGKRRFSGMFHAIRVKFLRATCNSESRGFFNETHWKIAPRRTDVMTWFDLFDLDDYVSFGGKA